jgi:tetratricopeptide (TPR) repeat protein
MIRGFFPLFCLLLAAGGFLAAPAAYATDGDSAFEAKGAYQEALRYKESGNFPEAETWLRKAVELSPGNADYHFELANLYAIRFDVLNEKSKEERGGSYLQLAAKELEQAIMIRSDAIPPRYNLGIVYKRQRLYEKARDSFREVLRRDPKQAAALMQIGSTYEEQGFFDEAKNYYEQAKELDGMNPNVQSALEELDQRKVQRSGDQQNRAYQDALANMKNLRQGPYTPDSHASDYYRDRFGSAENSQNMAASLPYLGSWLMNQFMKSKNDQD